jgi:hypothetical protein
MTTKLYRKGYSVLKDSLTNYEQKKLICDLTMKPFVMNDYKKADDIIQFPTYSMSSNHLYLNIMDWRILAHLLKLN